ncbi:hypothetical protein [Eisenibacter elegans]|jgi:nucleoside-diphosphate-sugar epimerase|uniref:hypothetical protein n=1 Tax=Eisenibacter elegans TaxID=997 RepID=UPI00040FEBB7|nr:hypothetical protein [Eisenibacter elegans]
MYGIIGLGWLGWPLAQYWAAEGLPVWGTHTQPERFHPNVSPLIQQAQLRLDSDAGDILPPCPEQVQYWVINIPPRLRAGATDYPAQMARLVTWMYDRRTILPPYVILISSTSVYPDVSTHVSEVDAIPNPEDENLLLQAEYLMQQAFGNQLTILRCGGLMGYERIPGKYYRGKKDLPGADVPVNYVHRDDVVQIIHQIIQQKHWGDVFNVVAPQHPTRQAVISQSIADCGWEEAQFNDTKILPHKVVLADKLQTKLGYKFLYPDPLHFSYTPSLAS